MKKQIIFITLISLIVSCKKENNNNNNSTTNTTPKDKIHSLSISFFNTLDSTVEYAGLYDEDADGPKLPNISGALLKKNSNYKVEIRLEDETNPAIPINISNKIKSNSNDYILCYIQNLGVTLSNYDKDAVGRKLGLTFDMQTGNSPLTGQIELNVKYQKGVKNGQCEPGEMYYKATIPVIIQD